MLNTLLSSFGLGPRTPAAARGNAFPKILSIGDWWQTALESAAGVIAVKPGAWVRVGEYAVPAQQMFHFGYGRADLFSNQGYLYGIFYDDTGVTALIVPGKVRLVQENAQGITKLTVYEARTEQLAGSAYDRQMMLALPEQTQFPWVGEDSKLVIEFLADAAQNLKLAAAATPLIWNIPVTVLQ